VDSGAATHRPQEIWSLADYRVRHAQDRSDTDVKADFVTRRGAPISTRATYVIEDGRPGAQPS